MGLIADPVRLLDGVQELLRSVHMFRHRETERRELRFGFDHPIVVLNRHLGDHEMQRLDDFVPGLDFEIRDVENQVDAIAHLVDERFGCHLDVLECGNEMHQIFPAAESQTLLSHEVGMILLTWPRRPPGVTDSRGDDLGLLQVQHCA